MKKISLAIAFLSFSLSPVLATTIEISPSTFDFGWAPDNAKISGDFTVKNTLGESVPLTSVQPSCGCTATDFTPESLGSAQEKKISITFNTRGYSGVKFNKSVQVKAGQPEEEFTVHMAGYVNDPNAKIIPDGNGIAAFAPGSSDKKTIAILNKSSETVNFSIVQPSAAWAKTKFSKMSIEPGQSVDLNINVDGSLEADRQTSLTLEVKGDTLTQRLTVAINTGTSPEPYRRIRSAPKAPSSPKTPVEKK